MYEYSWMQWILFFFCYCFFGWIFESTYVSLRQRHFVNRGFLRLPMLPLYGTGAVMMLFVSLPVKDNLFLVYLFGVIAATALEYVTGWGMEKLFKMRYWDYSSQRFQLHGYICLSSSVAWGFLTIFLTEVIHRPIERLVLGIHPVTEGILVAVVGSAFILDTIESTKAALDLGRALESMTKMKEELEEMQVQLALLKEELRDQVSAKTAKVQGETALRIEEILAEASARIDGIRESSAARAVESTAAAITELKEELKDRAEEKLEELEDWKETQRQRKDEWETAIILQRKKIRETAEKMVVLLERIAFVHGQRKKAQSEKSRLQLFYQRSMLTGNPSASSAKYKEALKEMKEGLAKKKEFR